MKDLIAKLHAGVRLSEEEAGALLRGMLDERTTPAQIAAGLLALRGAGGAGETAAELAGFARVMRAEAVDPGLREVAGVRDGDVPLLDVVGTGGDGASTLNISTAAGLIVAATGRARVAKHGNRAITSACGSADVLAQLGVPMPLGPKAARRLLEVTGFTFLFAPHYHRATGRVQGVRRELGALGIKTIFNMLGPLTSPAKPDALLIGAYSLRAAMLMHEAAGRLGVPAQVIVTRVTGSDGRERFVDEITTAEPFGEVIDTDDEDTPQALLMHAPEDAQMRRCTWADLAGRDAAYNAAAIVRLAEGETGGFADSALLTAAHGLGVAGVAANLDEAVAIAREAIARGAVRDLLRMIERTRAELIALNNEEGVT
jgi:anthranilate phosphoribosyltransferase